MKSIITAQFFKDKNIRDIASIHGRKFAYIRDYILDGKRSRLSKIEQLTTEEQIYLDEHIIEDYDELEINVTESYFCYPFRVIKFNVFDNDQKEYLISDSPFYVTSYTNRYTMKPNDNPFMYSIFVNEKSEISDKSWLEFVYFLSYTIIKNSIKYCCKFDPSDKYDLSVKDIVLYTSLEITRVLICEKLLGTKLLEEDIDSLGDYVTNSTVRYMNKKIVSEYRDALDEKADLFIGDHFTDICFYLIQYVKKILPNLKDKVKPEDIDALRTVQPVTENNETM